MAKVKNPLFSGDVSGDFGKKMIYRKGGVVTRYFTPKNPKTAAQEAHREAFRTDYMAWLTQEEADLLYALIGHDTVFEFFPVGAVFVSLVETDPSVLLGYGEWEAFGTGCVLAGYDAEQFDFDVAEEVGGVKTVVLAASELPIHTHDQTAHGHTQGAHAHTVQARKNVAGFGISLNGMGNGTGILDALILGTTTPPINSTVAINNNTGGGTGHNNLMPYFVCYFWKRTG